MPKSITWILFNSKCDVERLKEIEKESKERDQAEGSHHPWIQWHPVDPGLLGGESPEVI